MARKQKVIVPKGIAHIHSTHNNTIISFTDPKGNVLAWSSAGAIGYKGSKKSTPYAAQLACTDASKKVMDNHGMREIDIILKGIGPGKIAAAKQLEISGFKIKGTKDATPLAHNGTRPPKKILKRRKK